MGPMLVVPRKDRGQLTSQLLPPQRDEWQFAQDLLGRQDHALDDRNAALLADGAKAWADAVTSAPLAVFLARPELRALVADQMAWRRTGVVNHPAEKHADLERVRLMIEDGKALDSAGEMIHDNGQPMAKGPSLR